MDQMEDCLNWQDDSVRIPSDPSIRTLFQLESEIIEISPQQYLNNQQNEKPLICERLKEYHGLAKIIQSILDITRTVIKIMRSCNIHECKCEQSTDTILYAFLHFDEYATGGICGHAKKKVCKDEFQYELKTKCNFTKDEAKLTYCITKYAFNAFFFHQAVPRFDELFIDQCTWQLAAKRTFTAYKNMKDINQSELATIKANIFWIYQDYVDKRLMKNKHKNINKCNKK